MADAKLHSSINEIAAQDWNRLCGTDYPFLRHEFLSALEESGSVGGDTGWQPLHLSIERDGRLVCVMPLYAKSHSWGEYVFDWAWADAWQRYGLDYYPKLLTAIPFTPATGPRFGTELPIPETVALLSQTVRQLCNRFEMSGWHGLFVDADVRLSFVDQGLMSRLGTQYHWFNRGYTSFEDYLAHFSSRKRKSVRKERQKIQNQEVHLEILEGGQILDDHLDLFYQFYQRTYRKRGQRGYLSAEFFKLLHQNLPDQLVLVLAYHENRAVAGALSLKSSTCLYGRYWGCLEKFDSLHFEACYYQGIEYCIERGLQRFDPGAQGEHKIQRGFEPIETWSVHWIEETGFRPAIGRYLDEEASMMREQIAALSDSLPFRRGD